MKNIKHLRILSPIDIDMYYKIIEWLSKLDISTSSIKQYAANRQCIGCPNYYYMYLMSSNKYLYGITLKEEKIS